MSNAITRCRRFTICSISYLHYFYKNIGDKKLIPLFYKKHWK
nr:MAG TPA: hypothetical protein [Caudoviricetes sp.]